MSMSDPVGDMLTRIRNAQRARHSVCVAPASKLRENVLGVLKREGFIRGYASEQLRPGIAGRAANLPQLLLHPSGRFTWQQFSIQLQGGNCTPR